MDARSSSSMGGWAVCQLGFVGRSTNCTRQFNPISIQVVTSQSQLPCFIIFIPLFVLSHQLSCNHFHPHLTFSTASATSFFFSLATPTLLQLFIHTHLFFSVLFQNSLSSGPYQQSSFNLFPLLLFVRIALFLGFCVLGGTCFIVGFSPRKTTGIDSCERSNAPPSSYLVANHYCDKLKLRTILRKMIWELGLACVPLPRRRPGFDENDDDRCRKTNLEHNKAWLLAESGGCGAEVTNADPQHVPSSFRFSFCSQVELETSSTNSFAAATVLMVNLDDGMNNSRARELKCRRMEALEKSISPVANTLLRFNYGEILSATRNFSKGRVLGRGALSCVFRGRVGLLRAAVAIKRLDKEDKESAKAFCRELMIASSLHNPNVVPLVGFCVDPEEGLFLVYKFVSGGSLEHHLHERKCVEGSSPLPWSARYKVATGIAEAVSYLHNGTERCVVHRDIKPSNILLSSKKIPKLCDFGLATWTSAPSVPFLCTTVKGTFGYLAPEYFQHGKVSDKTDVYAFGVVLLELITGRKPIEAKKPAGEENLVLWAKPLLQKGKGAIEELVDPRLKCSVRFSNQMAQMIEAAAACVTNEESRRPGIQEIIAILRGQEERPFPKRKKSGLLGNGLVVNCYSQLQQTNKEMKRHLALAMLGASEFEDDDYLYGR